MSGLEDMFTRPETRNKQQNSTKIQNSNLLQFYHCQKKAELVLQFSKTFKLAKLIRFLRVILHKWTRVNEKTSKPGKKLK